MNTKAAALCAILSFTSLTSWSAPEVAFTKYKVTVTNLTRAQGWGLPVLVSHDRDLKLYQAGEEASDELRVLAEDGDNKPLVESLRENPDVLDVVAGDAPLAPGKTQVFWIKTNQKHPLLSLAGMLGSTNDTFAGLHHISRTQSSMVYYGNAYDAGTEANNEKCEFIPGPPCGNPGVRAPDGSEGFVYVSNGINGEGDLAAATFGWQNPVLKIVIKKGN